MMEEWRDIPGYEGRYQASDAGRVRSLRRRVRTGPGGTGLRWIDSCVLAPSPPSKGNRYPNVRLDDKSLRVHVLVALTFHGPRPADLETLHLDDDKTNSRASNLRYGTRGENVKMAWAARKAAA